MTPTAYPAEFEESCRWYPRNIQVVDRTGKVRPFTLYPVQKQLEYEVWKARQQGEPCFLIVLKARREGISTWVAARFYRDSKEFEHHRALVMAHDDGATKNVLDMVRFFFKTDPAKPETEKDSVAALKFKNGSEFFIYTAGARARAARSFNAQGVHLCFDPDTPILVGHGDIRRARDVRVGDVVLTHNGHETTVKAVASRPNNDPCVSIVPWLGGPITLTWNHDVFTHRGWVQAGEIRPGDYVKMPVRRICEDRRAWPSMTLAKAKKDRLGRSRTRTGAGQEVVLDESMGYTVGYFLAEGHVAKQRSGAPGRLVMARDKDEKHFADRAWVAASRHCSSRGGRQSPNSRTYMDEFNGSAFAEWIDRTFNTPDKHIPDWVFSAGEPFLRGLVAGYLCGDGSKSVSPGKQQAVFATSIRPSLITQVRDIVASLGIGWGNIANKPAGVRSGRNEKEAWTVYWSGDAARALRTMMGLSSPVRQKKGMLKKYLSEPSAIWLPVREVRPASSETVYDIEVAHKDHSFRTLHFCISNSELAYYPDPEVYDSVMQVTPNTYPTLVIIESTASGPDDAMDAHWRQAVEGSSGFVPKFFAWFDFGEYARDLTYKDLIARGPKAYVEANRLKLEEEKNALGEGKPITLRDLRAAALLGDSGSGGPGAKTTGAQGGSLADAGTEVEGTGPRRRGPVPSREAGWDDDTRPSGDGRRKRSKRVSRQGLLGGGHEPERLPSGHDVEILKKIALRNLHSEEYLTTIATRFRESLTEYEQGLIAEFDLSLEQINWLRWITHVKCRGDDLVRRREYPSRPEEAFEAASEIVLDPNTLKQWMRASEPMPTKTIHFQIMELMDGTITVCPTESIVGNTTIWKEPVAGRDYVMGVDPSSGLTEGDWQVACVLDVETGEQVAEFRGKLDPDVAIGQIEGLGVYYNKAFTGCEANSIGLAFNRALADSGSLPLFEREQPDRNEPWKKTKILGWITNARTRDTLITEVRKAVREARCPIRSMETLREGRTLIVTRKPNSPEKIEARPGYHDDGIFAYGLALLMRNRQLPEEPTEEGESQIKKEEVPELVQRLLEDLSEPSRLPIHARGLRHIGGGGQRYIDKRRWVL